jgi:DNA-binding NarL/FixJ family response regulator
VADDLIWSTRLRDLVRVAGGEPVTARHRAALEAALPDVAAAVVDLTARGYDGVALVALAAAAGRPVLALAPHDDVELRRRALAAGAHRVVPYRRLAEDGEAVLRRFLQEGGSRRDATLLTAPPEGAGRSR